MNEVEAQQLCDSAISALSHGNINLGVFPRLIRRIIDEKAWLIRKLPGEGIVEMKSLAELVTTPPILGWGEDPAKIEAIIRDDVEVLAMWREAMKQQGSRPDLCDNITQVGSGKGTGNARAPAGPHLQGEGNWKSKSRKLMKARCLLNGTLGCPIHKERDRISKTVNPQVGSC